MKKKQSFSEKLLLLFADFLDAFRQPITLSSFNRWLEGDSRYRPFKRWLEKYFEKKGKQALYSTIYQFKRSGYLKIKTSSQGNGYFLTPKGEEKVLRIKIKSLKKRLDPKKYWLMIIFDIPEKRRKDRALFRFYLYNLGFQKIQQSVWISPYDIYDEVKEVIKKLGLNRYIKVLKVKELGEI